MSVFDVLKITRRLKHMLHLNLEKIYQFSWLDIDKALLLRLVFISRKDITLKALSGVQDMTCLIRWDKYIGTMQQKRYRPVTISLILSNASGTHQQRSKSKAICTYGKL